MTTKAASRPRKRRTSASEPAPEPTAEAPAETPAAARSRWGADFDPDRLALLELRMWKAYYRRQPARLFGTLVLGLREQAHVRWPRALVAAVFLTKAAVGFARATGDYERFAPDVARGYRWLGLPGDVDVGGGRPRGAALVGRPPRDRPGRGFGGRARRSPGCMPRSTTCRSTSVAEAGRLRGIAAEVRDRGAIDGSGGSDGSRRGLLAGGGSPPARVVSEAGGSSRLRRGAAAPATRLDVARSAADDPPGRREQPGGKEQLERRRR